MYHVHSYSPRPTDPDVVAGTATYGNVFTSAVEDGNLFGVQFHPEKSSDAGLQMIRNFLGACGR